MLYLVTMIYLGLIYVRPNELNEGWEEVPLVMMASVVAAPLLGWMIVQRRGRVFEMPQDRLLWGFWFAIVLSNLAAGWLGGAIQGVTSFAQVMFQYALIRSAVRTLPQLRIAIVLLTCYMLFHATSGIHAVELRRRLRGHRADDHRRRPPHPQRGHLQRPERSRLVDARGAAVPARHGARGRRPAGRPGSCH